MQDIREGLPARVENSHWNAVTVMSATPVETIKSILGRLGIAFEEGLPKECYLTAMNDALCEDPSIIITILPENMIHFLIEVWENDEVIMDSLRWNFMEYLKLFGFLTYHRSDDAHDKESVLYVIPEMKEYFYFTLKSKKNQLTMERYTEREKLISGFMYYYGFVDTRILHEYYVRASSSVVSYQDFMDFLTGRCSFWAFGSLLKDVYDRKQFFQYHSVQNPEILALYMQQHADCPYKKISREDLIYISDGTGIDNRWPGLNDLAVTLYDESSLDYYQATVMIRLLLDMIQNGKDLPQIRGEMSKVGFSSDKALDKAVAALNLLYENVPVFEYRGHSRREYQIMFHEQEVREKQKAFKLIQGGKQEG